MTRFIFIFSILLLVFLTIVSFDAFSGLNLPAKIETFSGNDTIAVIFKADFENNDLSGWKQITEWEVSGTEKISGERSLKHLAGATSGSASVFHSVSSGWGSTDTEWSFKLKNGNWDPSSSNRFWFYLSADTVKTEIVNGWAVGVNISGTADLLELWRIRNGKADSLIVETDLDWNASTQATIWAKRSASGVWSLQFQKPGDAKSKVFSGNDDSLAAFRNVGLFFNYTPTRAGLLWIDDISVVQLVAGLFIEKLTLLNANTLTITFNKPINQETVLPANIKLSDENNQIVRVTQVVQPNGSDKSIDIHFDKPIGAELSLSVSGVSDLSGNVMIPDNRTISLSFPPEPGSILINEVLFNPFSGGTDFVELVNVSSVPVALSQLKLATRSDDGELKQIYAITTTKRMMQPGEYLVCTKDQVAVMAQYATNNPASLVAMSSFPSFPDDAGIVVLLNNSLEIIDEFSYSAKMHSPFLAEEEGVSLERASLKNPTGDGTNWLSAAASAGFATPGLPNSQTRSEAEVKNEITCEPQAFSPNGDGYNDELTIRFQFDKPGYIANVRVFDAAGRLVNHLVKNQSLAQEGSWRWDGRSESGQKMNIGVYIVLVEVFDREGRAKAYKKTCTITDRLE